MIKFKNSEVFAFMLTIFNNKCDFQRADCRVAVLPIGAVEQHGSHLPVGTDTFISSELARRIAGELDAYLLPAIPIACSIEHRLTKGTVYMKAATLAALIKDIAESLQFSGFRKLYLVNGHGGNWIIKPTIRELNRELQELDVILVSTQLARSRIQEVMEYGVPPDIHAGETETSLMLHLHRESVGAIQVPPDRTFYPQDYMDYFDAAQLSEDGYWGYPERATAEKGKKWLDILVEVALEYIRHIEETRQKLNHCTDAEPEDH
ncbi:creatininase family protein [Paenibacillus oceani]|uniref:Creatininase family protein n=1 Tax=Paenibacillus oceani TaxID=2772510 RepID=A0A927C8I8_9BACL|nr:creatininase family protein [Paenibacillus oceani]MBD2861461.1 creatininase family protein [Paenibacillus oceani]